VNNTLQAIDLLRGAGGHGLTTLTASEVVVDADVPEIPVGVDGEMVMMPGSLEPGSAHRAGRRGLSNTVACP
jgi:hypothetical protein